MTKIKSKSKIALKGTISTNCLSSIALLAVLGTSCQVAAEAVNEADENIFVLEEITVTARKREENMQDVPISITSLNSTQLKTADLGKSQELSNYVTGLTISSPFAASNPLVFLRGAGNSSFDELAGGAVGVYLDNVFIGPQAGKMLQMYDIESVQVLRGPQGTLFGKNNSAGSISFNSVKPGDEFDGYTTLSMGRFGQFDVEGGVTVPLSDSFSSRISFNSRSSDGYGEIRNAADEKVSDHGKIDEWAVRMQLRWQTENADVLLLVHHAEADDDRVPAKGVGINPDGTLGPQLFDWVDPDDDPYVNYNSFPETEKIDTTGASLSIDYDFENVTLTSISAMYLADRIASLETDHQPETVLEGVRAPKNDQFSQELRVASNDEKKLQWVAGLYYIQNNLDAIKSLNAPTFFGCLICGEQQITLDSKTYSAFAEGIYDINDTWSLTVGARFTHDRKDMWQENEILFKLSGGLQSVYTSETRDDAVSGRVILDQKLNDNIMLYYSISRGFQGGGIAADLTTPPGTTYKPEFVTTYELGWKTTLFDNRVRFNGSAFYNKYKDIQVFTLSGGEPGEIAGASVYTNAGRAESYGLDLELQAAVTDRLFVNAGMEILDTKYKDLILAGRDGFAIDGSGKSFLFAPEVDLFVSADYRVTLNDNDDLIFHADYGYRSKISLGIDAFDELATGDARGLLNLRVSYQHYMGSDKSLEVALWAKNVGSKKYIEYYSPLLFLAHNEYIYGPPSTYGVQVSYNY